MATGFMDYTRHPLSWERTDLGKPLLKLAAALVALLLVGFAVVYLLTALAQSSPAPIYRTDGLFGGDGPLVWFALLGFLAFLWPTNVLLIFLFSLPILGLQLAWRRWNEREVRPVERRRSVEIGQMGAFMGR